MSAIYLEGSSYFSSTYDGVNNVFKYYAASQQSIPAAVAQPALRSLGKIEFVFDESKKNDTHYVILSKSGDGEVRVWIDKKTFYVSKTQITGMANYIHTIEYSDYQPVAGSQKKYPFYSKNIINMYGNINTIEEKVISLKLVEPKDIAAYFDLKNPKGFMLSDKSVFAGRK